MLRYGRVTFSPEESSHGWLHIRNLEGALKNTGAKAPLQSY